jgi:hypothetical protein
LIVRSSYQLLGRLHPSPSHARLLPVLSPYLHLHLHPVPLLHPSEVDSHSNAMPPHRLRWCWSGRLPWRKTAGAHAGVRRRIGSWRVGKNGVVRFPRAPLCVLGRRRRGVNVSLHKSGMACREMRTRRREGIRARSGGGSRVDGRHGGGHGHRHRHRHRHRYRHRHRHRHREWHRHRRELHARMPGCPAWRCGCGCGCAGWKWMCAYAPICCG